VGIEPALLGRPAFNLAANSQSLYYDLALLHKYRSSLTALKLVIRVASASVRDGISAAAVVFAPDYGSEDDHQIRPHLFSRDCAGSTSPDSLAPAA
jgi:hypothetical protein